MRRSKYTLGVRRRVKRDDRITASVHGCFVVQLGRVRSPERGIVAARMMRYFRAREKKKRREAEEPAVCPGL
jgi:hypothetical protein